MNVPNSLTSFALLNRILKFATSIAIRCKSGMIELIVFADSIASDALVCVDTVGIPIYFTSSIESVKAHNTMVLCQI
ncbi:hypothetical protein D3C76_1463590 [compost metagenome]